MNRVKEYVIKTAELGKPECDSLNEEWSVAPISRLVCTYEQQLSDSSTFYPRISDSSMSIIVDQSESMNTNDLENFIPLVGQQLAELPPMEQQLLHLQLEPEEDDMNTFRSMPPKL
jgi:hypothetical protein